MSYRNGPSSIPRRVVVAGGLLAAGAAWPQAASAANARELNSSAHATLNALYAANPKAKTLGDKARAILVFPEILKAGAIVGGLGGEGAMMQKGRVIAFYRISAASYGLQLGAQKYSYALFYMNDKAIQKMKDDKGWSVGTGLSVVFVDDGFAKPMTNATITKDVYAVAFGQKGLMAGSGLEGAKIKQITPDP